MTNTTNKKLYNRRRTRIAQSDLLHVANSSIATPADKSQEINLGVRVVIGATCVVLLTPLLLIILASLFESFIRKVTGLGKTYSELEALQSRYE